MKIDLIIVPKQRTRKSFGDIPGLAASIKEVGMLHPVVVDGDKSLVAGERRLRAAISLGWTDVPARTIDSLDDALLALKAERDENTCREAFRPTEAERMADRLEPFLRKEAQKRKAHGKTAPGKKSNASAESAGASESRQAVAAAVGMSHDTLSKIREVTAAAKANPDLLPLVEEMDRTGNVTKALRAVTRAEAVKQVATLPSKKYRVFYADPPWKYGDSREGLKGTTGASAHYPSMSIAELCALPIQERADDNAILFLWVTAPLALEVQPVIDAWGFIYKTQLIWDKIKHNMGHYTSVRHELLYICTRGSCLPDVSKLFDSVQSIERKAHSQKPEEFREIIDTLYPHGKRIELFARTKAPGWDTYGNHCDDPSRN